jgi:hypothetical protein
MTLLHGFSVQLGGQLTITSGQGLRIDLVFAEEPQFHASPMAAGNGR